MKYLIIILLFTSCLEKVELPIEPDEAAIVHDCPPGYSWMPSFYHSSLHVYADECLPDSVCERLNAVIGKCIQSYAKSGGCYAGRAWVSLWGKYPCEWEYEQERQRAALEYFNRYFIGL